jgi:hypothetical protein
MLAGTCLATLFGRSAYRRLGGRIRETHPERREATFEATHDDVIAAAVWVYGAAGKVLSRSYDKRYEPVHETLIGGGDEVSVVPVVGFKS